MNSDKRLLLAFGISFLILVLYPVYLKWLAPPSSITAKSPEWLDAVGVPETTRTEIGKSESLEASSDQEGPEKVHSFSHKHFDVEFSDRGAVITKLELKSWKKGQSGEILISRSGGGNGAFLAAIRNQGINFEEQVFSLEALNQSEGEVRFSTVVSGEWRLMKRFLFSRDEPVFSLDVEAENLGDQEEIAPLELASRLDVNVIKGRDPVQPESFVYLGDKLVSAHLNKIEKKPYLVEGKIFWTALVRKYFAVIVNPERPASLVRTTSAHSAEGVVSMQTVLQMPGEKIRAGGILKQRFLIFAGPAQYRDLKFFGQGFEHLLSHGFFGVFKLWLLVALQWAHKVTGNYGWAILLITAAVKLLFTPLTHMSFASMKKMQALQPKLKALQERHKNDQAKLSKEMMELYKRNKVNPMSGCLPMLLQIPIFIAFYQVLAQTVELKGEAFIFWIRDLSEPDRAWTLPFSIPFLGDAINILPLLMLGSMVWQQHLTPQTGTPEQQKVMMMMPILMGFIFYSLPSGLVLYWFASNLLSIFHQLFIKGKALPHHEEG